MKHRALGVLIVAVALLGSQYAVRHARPAQTRSEPAVTLRISGLSADEGVDRELAQLRASRSRTTPPRSLSGGVGSHPVSPKHHWAPAVQQRAATPSTGGIAPVWIALVNCEASGHWDYGKPGRYIDPGYNFEGGPNFVNSTWLAHGGGRFAQHAYDATPWQQIVVAKATLRAEGVHAWPDCGPRVGLTMADSY